MKSSEREDIVEFYRTSRVFEDARHRRTLALDSTEPFRVLSYNLLAQGSIKREQYPYCANDVLKWWFRRERLIDEIQAYAPDLAAFQEMDQYDKFFKKEFPRIGLDSLYVRKKENHVGNQGDGLCIAWRSDRFELLQWKTQSLAETMKHLPGATPNISVFALFQDRRSPKHYIVFVTCHLYWNWNFDHLRAIQAHFMFAKLHEWVSECKAKWFGSYETIVCGDFNSDPTSVAYQMITGKHMDVEHYHKVMEPSGLDDARLKALPKLFRAPNSHYHSAYALQQIHPHKQFTAHAEIAWTNHVSAFKDTLDYIFFRDTGKLVVRRLLMVPEPALAEAEGGLPNHFYSSDHVALVSEFGYTGSS